jgi:hypothetical protein
MKLGPAARLPPPEVFHGLRGNPDTTPGPSLKLRKLDFTAFVPDVQSFPAAPVPRGEAGREARFAAEKTPRGQDRASGPPSSGGLPSRRSDYEAEAELTDRVSDGGLRCALPGSAPIAREGSRNATFHVVDTDTPLSAESAGASTESGALGRPCASRSRTLRTTRVGDPCAHESRDHRVIRSESLSTRAAGTLPALLDARGSCPTGARTSRVSDAGESGCEERGRDRDRMAAGTNRLARNG